MDNYLWLDTSCTGLSWLSSMARLWDISANEQITGVQFNTWGNWKIQTQKYKCNEWFCKCVLFPPKCMMCTMTVCFWWMWLVEELGGGAFKDPLTLTWGTVVPSGGTTLSFDLKEHTNSQESKICSFTFDQVLKEHTFSWRSDKINTFFCYVHCSRSNMEGGSFRVFAVRQWDLSLVIWRPTESPQLLSKRRKCP